MKSLVYLAYAIGWWLIKHLPENFAYGLGRAIADFAYKKNGKGVKRLRKNYSRVLGIEVSDELVKSGMRDRKSTRLNSSH